MNFCSVEGCERQSRSRGMCTKHYSNCIYHEKNESARAIQRRSKAKHRDRVRAASRKFYHAHKEEYRDYSRAWRLANPEKQRETRRKWREANPEKVRAKDLRARAAAKLHPDRHKGYRLKALYGISLMDLKSMREAQNNTCAICSETFTKTPRVDHSHITGEIRGLLCNHCNLFIGYFKDDPIRIEAAAAYLRRASETKLKLERTS